MPSLREIRRKVRSVRSIQKITRAMKIVSAARVRRAQERILAARPFSDRMAELLADLAARLRRTAELTGLPPPQHPFFRQTAPAAPCALLVVTADRGLCGSFNANILRRALEFIAERPPGSVHLFCAGRKGRDFFRRQGMTVRQEYVHIFRDLKLATAELISRDLQRVYLDEDAGSVWAIYGEFRSMLLQRPKTIRLLPVEPPPRTDPEQRWDYEYEPEAERLLEALLPRYFTAQIWRILLENLAAETAARMNAMDNATRSAQDLIGSLTLQANKVRQAAITKEILEVVSGAEALETAG